jgi:hypothetical protein
MGGAHVLRGVNCYRYVGLQVVSLRGLVFILAAYGVAMGFCFYLVLKFQ